MACLASRAERLGTGCRPALEAAARSPLVPGSMRRIFEPGFRAALPAACQPAASRLCPEVAPGDGRVFACLYARTDRVGESCSNAALAALEGAN